MWADDTFTDSHHACTACSGFHTSADPGDICPVNGQVIREYGEAL